MNNFTSRCERPKTNFLHLWSLCLSFMELILNVVAAKLLYREYILISYYFGLNIGSGECMSVMKRLLKFQCKLYLTYLKKPYCVHCLNQSTCKLLIWLPLDLGFCLVLRFTEGIKFVESAIMLKR